MSPQKLAISVFCAIHAVAGFCSPLTLKQPANIPVFVDSYKVPALVGASVKVPCVLNLVNCTETATIVNRGSFGSRTPCASFPVKDIVRGEFRLLLSDNFTPVSDVAQAKLELKIESRRIVVEVESEKFGDKWVDCDIALAIMLLNPNHLDIPYFSKVYSTKCGCKLKEDGLVPQCIYESVQKTVKKFGSEMTADANLMARLGGLAK